MTDAGPEGRVAPAVRVLALSGLFPNAAQPNYGVFVLNRLKAVSRFCAITVVAPIHSYLLLGLTKAARTRDRAVPLREKIEGFDVHHPRFAIVPRYLKWFDALSYWWAACKLVAGLETREGLTFDVVDVHWTYPDIAAGFWLARRRGKKLLVTVRGKEALYPGERSLRRWLLGYFMRRADAVITLSDELKDLVIGLGVAPARVRTILNGVDRGRFHSRPKNECRQRLGLSPDRKLIISVGALIERKGHHELVRIMPGLSRTDAVDLCIIGGAGPEGDLTGRLNRMIAELGLTNVRLVNKVPHDALADWYGAADLFCLATRGEGCPNVVLEALACGTPVVSTDVGAIRELVAEGENGFVIGIDQLGELEDVVRRALHWNWDRDRIAERMNAWGWPRCADEVIKTYRAVLGQEPSR
jgi:glycosyltransferase involved in cell wall biosynthesis